MSKVGTFYRTAKEYGIGEAIRRTSHYLGISTYYSVVKYPVNNLTFTVTQAAATSQCWQQLEDQVWEPECIKRMAEVVKPGQTILDIGAWIGPYTLLFSRLVGDKGRVYSFEPDAKAFQALSKNIRKNRLANVTAENMAVFNKSGAIEMNLHSYGEGNARIPQNGLLPLIQMDKWFVAEATTIDDYCRNTIRPDGIKIDAEGAEALILEGGKKTLRECHPWVLLEFFPKFMTEKRRQENWKIITADARSVEFVSQFNAFVQY